MEMMKILKLKLPKLEELLKYRQGLLGWLQKLMRFKHKIEFEGIAKDLRLHMEENGGFGLTIHTHTF